MKENQALEQPFLDRVKALTKVAEVFRCSRVTLLICEMVAFEVRAEAKIFRELPQAARPPVLEHD